MECLQLLRRLCEIEAAIGVADPLTLRRMIVETQDYILEVQRESVETARRESGETARLGGLSATVLAMPAHAWAEHHQRTRHSRR